MSENEIDYKQKYNDLIAHINTVPFITSPMGDLPVTSTTVRNLLDKLIKTEEENHNLSKQLYDLNIYINTIEEIQNNSTKHLIDLIKKDIPEEYHKQIDEYYLRKITDITTASIWNWYNNKSVAEDAAKKLNEKFDK